MKPPPVYITKSDAASLRRFIHESLRARNADVPALQLLSAEVERASAGQPDLPGGVIRVGSPVTLEFTDTGECMNCILVYPDEADLETGKVSILAPIGIALVGCRPGDVIEWLGAAGTFRARILETFPPIA